MAKIIGIFFMIKPYFEFTDQFKMTRINHMNLNRVIDVTVVGYFYNTPYHDSYIRGYNGAVDCIFFILTMSEV